MWLYRSSSTLHPPYWAGRETQFVGGYGPHISKYSPGNAAIFVCRESSTIPEKRNSKRKETLDFAIKKKMPDNDEREFTGGGSYRKLAALPRHSNSNRTLRTPRAIVNIGPSPTTRSPGNQPRAAFPPGKEAVRGGRHRSGGQTLCLAELLLQYAQAPVWSGASTQTQL